MPLARVSIKVPDLQELPDLPIKFRGDDFELEHMVEVMRKALASIADMPSCLTQSLDVYSAAWLLLDVIKCLLAMH